MVEYPDAAIASAWLGVTTGDAATQLNTTDQQLSTIIEQKKIIDLPLLSRDPNALILLSPGTVASNSTLGGFSVNGQRERNNNFMVDGQDNNEPGVAGAAQPLNKPDLIQEVRLITNQFLAEYGRNSSSVFNAITKAGTNNYHGSLFWFHNSNALNACSNTDKRAGFCNASSTNPSRQHAPFRIENQIGGTLGGPLARAAGPP